MDEAAIDGLKFSECLPIELATEMLERRLHDVEPGRQSDRLRAGRQAAGDEVEEEQPGQQVRQELLGPRGAAEDVDQHEILHGHGAQVLHPQPVLQGAAGERGGDDERRSSAAFVGVDRAALGAAPRAQALCLAFAHGTELVRLAEYRLADLFQELGAEFVEVVNVAVLAEPLEVHGRGTRNEREARVVARLYALQLEEVGDV